MKTLFLLTIFLPAVKGLLPNKSFRNSIISKSDNHIRPVEKTRVEVIFVLTSLNKLDSLNQELGTTFRLYMRWTDPRLSWTTGGTYPDNIVFYVNEIWTPPLVISNAIDESVFHLRDDIFPMRVNSSGTVTWISRMSPTTTCFIDTSIFPVDTQECDINITSWVHSTNELHLEEGSTKHYPDAINLDYYTKDKAWQLIKTSVEVVNLTGGYGIQYHKINYRFTFTRNKRFYWVLLVIPGICLAFLQPLVFLIPLNDKDTRVMYASSLLLSLVFYTSLLNDILPPIFSDQGNHEIGESFAHVMTCGTVITGVVIIEILCTSILESFHGETDAEEPNQSQENVLICCLLFMPCLFAKGRQRCKKCFCLKMVNAIFFFTFLAIYSKGIESIRCDLKDTC